MRSEFTHSVTLTIISYLISAWTTLQLYTCSVLCVILLLCYTSQSLFTSHSSKLCCTQLTIHIGCLIDLVWLLTVKEDACILGSIKTQIAQSNCHCCVNLQQKVHFVILSEKNSSFLLPNEGCLCHLTSKTRFFTITFMYRVTILKIFLTLKPVFETLSD